MMGKIEELEKKILRFQSFNVYNKRIKLKPALGQPTSPIIHQKCYENAGGY